MMTLNFWTKLIFLLQTDKKTLTLQANYIHYK